MSNLLTKNPAAELYQARIDKARKQFADSPALSTILSPDIEPKTLAAFLIYYNALGVSMTKPVETWIDRAGEACKAQGLKEIGKSLCLHAKHEAGHEQMMMKDTEVLVADWNTRYEPKLNAEELMAHPATEGVRKYIQLHEDVIVSDAPFCQLAIELEIENLSVSIGPSWIKQFKHVLGDEVVKKLSFLEEHISIDVSHTHFNEKQLNKFLSEYPEALDSLVNAGEKALKAYNMFLDDCIELAEELAKG